jgi:hypothetical protein
MSNVCLFFCAISEPQIDSELAPPTGEASFLNRENVVVFNVIPIHIGDVEPVDSDELLFVLAKSDLAVDRGVLRPAGTHQNDVLAMRQTSRPADPRHHGDHLR